MDAYDNWTTKTPDQIEQEVIQYFAGLDEAKGDLTIEVLAMFRKRLSQEGYVFYQP